MRDIGTLGGRGSYAHGINDAGQVVGVSDTAEGFPHAFITGPNGAGMIDLNSLVNAPLEEATAINNAGQVVAVGVIPAVPEPEIFALFVAGLALTGFMARQRDNDDHARLGLAQAGKGSSGLISCP